MQWAGEHPIGAAFIAIVSLILIGVLLSSLGSDVPSDEVVLTSIATGSATPEQTEATATSDEGRLDVPQLECNPLITLEEVDVALDVVGENAGIVRYTGGEACNEALGDRWCPASLKRNGM